MSLLALQRDMRAWLTEESEEAGLRLGDQAAPGLAVYLNTYRSQLVACLADTFAMVHAWLGDTAFESAAAQHVDACPPTSWTLDAYAKEFPETLAWLYPEDPEIAELAYLERALAESFVGSDASSLDADSLGEIDWDRAVFEPVPTFTTLPVRTNAAEIWSALKDNEAPPAVALLPEPGVLAVWRKDFTPSFRSLDGDEAEALGEMIDGQSFGEFCTAMAERHGEDDGLARAGAWLAQWFRDGVFARVTEA